MLFRSPWGCEEREKKRVGEKRRRREGEDRGDEEKNEPSSEAAPLGTPGGRQGYQSRGPVPALDRQGSRLTGQFGGCCGHPGACAFPLSPVTHRCAEAPGGLLVGGALLSQLRGAAFLPQRRLGAGFRSPADLAVRPSSAVSSQDPQKVP